MKKITNTENEFKKEWLFGGNPKAIVAQEAAGQKELVSSSQVPVKCNYPKKTFAVEQYQQMGISVNKASEDDNLFCDVTLPSGWKIEATDHHMWNVLIDDQGRHRAMIFYKAAFYDRDAFINFETRYQKGTDFYKDEKDPERAWDIARVAYVKDTVQNKYIWYSKKHFYDEHSKFLDEAEKFLNANLPDWQNINAYWED